MFRVFAVDDEASALEFVCQIVKKRCPGFEIVGTASGGAECLEQLKDMPVDVLLTDVRMPGMDGIALAERVSREYPEVLTIVISGYQEFDYVRGALKCGVYDYMLKPLVPAAFAEVFERLHVRLEEKLLQQRNDLLRAMSKGERVDEAKLRHCFSDEMYDCILIRRNGLPKRFARISTPEIYDAENGGMSIFGRDEMERIHLQPASTHLKTDIEALVHRAEGSSAYITAVSTAEPFSIARFADVLRRLYRLLDKRTVLGLSQVVYLENPLDVVDHKEEVDTKDLAAFERYLQMGNREKARRELKWSMQRWKETRLPQLRLEQQLRYILFLAVRTSGGDKYMQIGEHLLDDAFYSITSMDEMFGYMDDLLFADILVDGEEQKIDTPDQFALVCRYVDAHFAEAISMKQLCEKFGISQSYLSSMFRKYADKSFNTYLMEKRMETACSLMRANPKIFVREVAEAVGYTDPFYFSKSFRAYTGKTPREYLQAQEENQ